MKINEMIKILNGKILVGEDKADMEVTTACGSDMMSDVLAFTKVNAVLVTGLCNLQVIRTCEMMDIQCIIFCRNKIPTEEMLELAREDGMVVISTMHRMFNSCGILYEAGLRGGEM